MESLLAQLGDQKGLANYDRTDGLETLLKNLVNLNKDTLSYVDILVSNLPVLGPELGQSAYVSFTSSILTRHFTFSVVYDIKCLLDKVLDAVENVTDALLNSLLRSNIENYRVAACLLGFGIRILGTCI